MANLKRYTLEDAWKDWDVTVEVDHDILTEERAAEINSFWSGDEERLSDEDGDVVRAVIKYAARMWIYDLLEAGGVYVTEGGQARYWTEHRHMMEAGAVLRKIRSSDGAASAWLRLTSRLI